MAIENCLGDVKAQVDNLLLRGAFYNQLDAYKQGLKDYYIIVRGRKGMGKSAIAKVLQRDYEKQGNLCEFITPTAFSFPEFDSLYTSCSSVPGFPFDFMIREVWAYIIYTTAMKAILDSNHRIRKIATAEDITAITKYINDKGLKRKGARPSYLQVCDAILSSIRGSGYGHSPGPFEAVGKIIDGSVRDNAFDALRRIIDGSGVKFYLFIDETDQRWNEAENRDAVIRFLAGMVAVLHDIYFDEYIRAQYPRNLVVKIFLRDEAYATAPIANARVLSSRSSTIRWDRNSLFNMICTRLGIATGHSKKNPKFIWNSILPEVLSVDERRHTFDYLLDYTFYRPREVIDLYQKCIIQAAKSGNITLKGIKIVGRISEDDIFTVLPGYCSEFVEDEITEAKVVFPECREVLQGFTGKKWVEKPQYYLGVASEIAKRIGRQGEEGEILKKLFQFGFLGAIIDKSNQPTGGKAMEKIFWYDNRILNLMQANYLIVHRAFHQKCSLGTAKDPMNIWFD